MESLLKVLAEKAIDWVVTTLFSIAAFVYGLNHHGDKKDLCLIGRDDEVQANHESKERDDFDRERPMIREDDNPILMR